MLLDGQMSIFDYEAEEEVQVDLQKQKIAEIIKSNTGTEIVLYKSGIVGVIADYAPKVIIPQGDISKAFTPKWIKKTYLINKEGNVLGIAVGEVR